MIDHRCPACGRQAVMPDEDAGRTYRCDCGNMNVVPGGPAQPAAPKSTPTPAAKLTGAAQPGAAATATQPPGAPALVYRGGPSQLENFWLFVILAAIVVLLIVFLAKSGLNRLNIVVSVVILLFYGLWLLDRMLVIRCTKYTVTQDNITIEEGVLARHIDNIDLFRANDVNLEQTATQRMLGIGDVTIESSDKSMPKAVLRNLREPRDVFEKIRKAASEADQRRGVVQVER